MKKNYNFKFILISLLFFVGCATTSQRRSQEEFNSSMESIAEAITGKEISDDQVCTLSKEIKKDPEAQSAIQSISNSFDGKVCPIKYCPVTGKRFSSKLDICPEHHVKLKVVNQ